MTLFMVFRQFILRGEAIRLYRQMLRECRKIEHRPSREQLSRWIREEFENARHLKDEVHWPSSSGYIQSVCNIIHSLAKSFTVKSYTMPYTGVCVSESIAFRVHQYLCVLCLQTSIHARLSHGRSALQQLRSSVALTM